MLPAYAKSLLAKRRAGIVPAGSLAVFCGFHWRKHWSFPRHAWAVIVPDDAELHTMRFAFAAGLECIIIGDDQARMDDVARAMLGGNLSLRRLTGACRGDPAALGRITVYKRGP